MRFRGLMHDIASMTQFHRILWTLSKLVKSSADVFVFRLTSSSMYFIKSESAVNGGITVWTKLSCQSVFDDFNFEGQSPSENEIQLEIVPSTLMQAFKTAIAGSTSATAHSHAGGVSTTKSMSGSFNAKSLKMKLTKKQPQGPCLTIEVEMPSANMNNHTRILTHDIPVHVVTRRNWILDSDCTDPPYDLNIWLPPLKTIKNVVDKMKNLSHHIIITAEKHAGYDNSGCLKLNAENEFVSVTTTFNDLQQPAIGGDGDDLDVETAITVRVDVRKLATFLSSLQIPADNILVSFKADEAVHLRIAEDDFSFQYRLPAVNM